jgi:predicted nuclease of predicted toxin-antitoxin system
MKLLFDQNISYKILNLLPELFASSTCVKHENLIDATDHQIWEYAQENDFIIVTQDSDFNYLSSYHGFPPKVIWMRGGNQKTQAIANLLINHYNEIESFVEDNIHGCFEIIVKRNN